MVALRRHAEELTRQVRLARAKQETDAQAIQELQQDNARLRRLMESANEVRLGTQAVNAVGTLSPFCPFEKKLY